MSFKKQISIVCFLLFSFHLSHAQVEVAYAKVKDFKSVGFGGFLNFSFPVSESDYLTIEGGAQYFKNKFSEDLILIPVIAGYRYTLDRSGSGFYAEPFAGYAFGGSSIEIYDSNGDWEDGDAEVAGPVAGLGIGYLIDLGNIPFNFALRYQHSFGEYGANVFAFRISHTLGFRKRSDY